MEIKIPKIHGLSRFDYRVGYKIKGPGLGTGKVYSTGVMANSVREALEKVKRQVARTKHENPILENSWQTVELWACMFF